MPKKEECITSIILTEETPPQFSFDKTRRDFLKILLSTGIGTLILILFNRKAEALTFGQSGYTQPNYLTKIDEANSTVTYIGSAAIGSTDAQALWQIKRISVSSTITSVEWAGGNDSYDNVWANRASLDYS